MEARRTTKVKICGLRRLEDAALAVQLGAWSLGLNFYRHSRRYCRRVEATQISRELSGQVLLCGVFVNAKIDRIVRIVDEFGLDMVQLHGDEGPAFASEVARRTGCKVIKAARVRTRLDARQAQSAKTDYYLLDAYSEGERGGTGRTFNWELTDVIKPKSRLILSGGIKPVNVEKAIAVARPFAVDVASGVESSPGVKDHQLMEDLFAAVAKADISEYGVVQQSEQ